MSQDNVIEDVVSDVSRAFAKVINVSTEFAMAMIELRIQRLREAARRDEEQARAAREQTRMHHQADSAVWRAAMRPQWWRDAGAEDIGRVWRAASMWQDVDPRAAEARQVVVDRLAERGVNVDPRAPSQPSPDDVAWLSDALDRAAAAAAAAGAAEAGKARSRSDGGDKVKDPTVIDGEFRSGADHQAADAEAAEEARRHAEWESKAERYVRTAWAPERAERVLGCKAWGALVHEIGVLEEQGYDVEILLRGVPSFVDEAHTPAAFAVRTIRDRAADMVDLGTARREDPAVASEAATGAATRSDAAVQKAFDEATPDQIRAAGIAYWTQNLSQVKDRGSANYARFNIREWTEVGAESVRKHLDHQPEVARRGIQSQLQAATKSGGGQATVTPAVPAGDRVEQRPQAPSAATLAGDVHAAQAQQTAAGSAGEAEPGEGQAANVAAQAYPITTKEAVAAAAAKAQTGAAGVSTGGPASTRSATSRPAPQQNRDEPKGR